jgi:RNA polymerase sigma factor (sigma-70 family)
MISALKLNMINAQVGIEDLWQGVRLGQSNDQKQFYMLTYKTMMNICCRYAATIEDAEQWVNDGYIKIFKNVDKYGEKGSLEGWMKRIMVNTCLDNLRQTKAQYNAPHLYTKETTAIGQDYSTTNDALNNINANELLNVVQKLPATQRTIFNMYAMDGFSHKEIAQHLGIKESNSQWHLNQARNFLKEKLSNFKSKQKNEHRTI